MPLNKSQAAQELWKEAAERESPDTCAWREDEDGTWETDCGQAFVFVDDGPVENGMKYCCYCGKQIDALPYVEEADDG